VLNYLECQAIPALSTQAIVPCDCEKVADRPTGSGQSATGNPLSKLKPEEVFAGNGTFVLSWPIAGAILKAGRGPGQPIPCGHTAAIFQPPRS